MGTEYKPTADIVSELWEEAKAIFYDEIGEKKAAQVWDSTTLADTIQDLKTSKTRVSKQYSSHTVNIGGKSIDFKLGKIVQRLELLMQVGDTAMNSAPESVSLVWAAFRMMFTGFLKDVETCQLLVDAVDQVSDILFVCEIYALRYSRKGVMVETAGNTAAKVLGQIPAIYATVLKFSYETRRLLAGSNKFTRSWKTMFGKHQELSSIIEDTQNKRDDLQRMADIAFKEAATDVLEDLHENSKVLNELFDTMETFMVPTLKNIENEQVRSREQRNKDDIKTALIEQIQWLRSGTISEPEAPSQQLKSNIDRRHKGTARWLFDTEEFKTWHQSDNSKLGWLCGDGGIGKSIIISSVIEALEKEISCKKDSKPILLYFFCKIGNDTTQKGQKIFLHLLAQLLRKLHDDNKKSDDSKARKDQCVGLFKDAREKLTASANENSSFVKISSTLKPLLDDLARALDTRIYIVIDALDECTDRNDGFLEALKVMASSSADIRVLASSRPDSDINNVFGARSCLVVDGSRTVDDVRTYVRNAVRLIGRFTPQQKAIASTIIATRSEGKFRYANVVTEGLNRSSAKMTPFNKLMQELPNGMIEVYRKSLLALRIDDRMMLVTALRWLVCGEGQIDPNWIADEVYHVYDQDDDVLEESVNEIQVSEEDISFFESTPIDSYDDDGEQCCHTVDAKVGTAKMTHQETFSKLDQLADERHEILSDLRRIGRDFLKFNGNIVELDHKSVRDFVLDDERLARRQTLRCSECEERVANSSVFQAGNKHGHLLMVQMILRHLNSPSFQKKYILQEHSAIAPVRAFEASTINNGAGPFFEKTLSINYRGEQFISRAPPSGEAFNLVPLPSKGIDHASDEHLLVLGEDEHSDTQSVASFVSGATDVGPGDYFRTIGLDQTQSSDYVRYELSHWHRHLRAAEQAWSEEERDKESWETIYHDLHKFLDFGSATYQCWLRRVFPTRTFKTFDHPFHVACRFGLVSLVKLYLERNSSEEYVNMRNEYNATPLHFACGMEGDLNTIALLVSAGADMHAIDDWGATPLFRLIERDSAPIDAVKYLLDHGSSPRALDEAQITCLHLAAGTGQLEVCRLLLATMEVNVDAEDQFGETPLHYAFRFPNVPTELIQLLLDNEPNVNAQDKQSQGPLYEACSVGNVAGVRLLLDYHKSNASVDINDEDVFGSTPLHAAIKAGSLDLVKLLVSKDANPCLKDKQGHDPLFRAAEDGEADILDFLCVSLKKCGSSMQCLLDTDMNGQTSLHRAAARGKRECVEILLQHGDGAALCAQVNRSGATPLHSAARRGYADCVELILENRADPFARTNNGKTALDVAFEGRRRRTWEAPTQDFTATIVKLAKHALSAVDNLEVLDWAIEQRLEELCRGLVPKLDQLRDDGWTPLLLARQLGYHNLIPLFKDHEVSTKAKPTRWSRSDLVTFPFISDNGLDVSCKTEDFQYTGNWKTTYEFGLILANYPAPALSDHYYFEITILECEAQFPVVALGFTSKWSIRKNVLPGWKDVNEYTWGYHADDGRKWDPSIDQVTGEAYADPYGRGDTIGCGVDFKRGIIYYTRNGKRLPDAFTNVSGRLYPVLGMGEAASKVRANFGRDSETPFKYQPLDLSLR